ncbi:MAG: PH domain-containing protein, partial [Lachnospiraceae bacterium]|nr:PH domain-containing protein [Lachnospiraceae bacterium]
PSDAHPEQPTAGQPATNRGGQSRGLSIGILIFTVAVCMLVGIFLLTGEVRVSTTAEGLHIDATYWRNNTIAYSAIHAVGYVEDLPLGSRTNGYGGFRTALGNFRNERFGDYRLYSYVGCKSYVVLQTDDGVTVINAIDDQATRSLYTAIAEKIDQMQ